MRSVIWSIVIPVTILLETGSRRTWTAESVVRRLVRLGLRLDDLVRPVIDDVAGVHVSTGRDAAPRVAAPGASDRLCFVWHRGSP
jgi:hypothetical protein